MVQKNLDVPDLQKMEEPAQDIENPRHANEEANCCIKNELNKPLLPFGNEKLHVV
jgi:hypothetical protein